MKHIYLIIVLFLCSPVLRISSVDFHCFLMHWFIICFKLFYRKLSHANRCIYYFCCNRKQLHVSTYICSKTKTNICCKWFNMAILYSLVHLSIKKLHLVQIVTYENCLIEWTDKPVLSTLLPLNANNLLQSYYWIIT